MTVNEVKFKKIFIRFLILIAVFSLIGCPDEGGSSNADERFELIPDENAFGVKVTYRL